MAKRALEGERIRAIRAQKGLRQSAVAEACGISPSYLNLIEHNRRPVAGALLAKIARALGVEPAEISEGAEATLVAALDAVAGAAPDGAPPPEPSEEFAARFPGWARTVRRQAEQLAELERVVETLSDRMAHDPFLSASLHNVLSTVTSIRSTSAILTSGDEIEPEWQARFHRNIHEDSQRLAEAADGLVSYLEADAAKPRSGGLPQDEVDAWLERHDWRIPDGGPDGGDPDLVSDEARAAAARLAARAASDAAALPLDALAPLVAETQDPTEIAGRMGCAPDLAMRRLAALPAEAFPTRQAPGLVICDASGTITHRKPAQGFEPPRFGAACALWPLFEALHRPGVPVTRRLRTHGRDAAAFRATAFAATSFPAGYDLPPTVEATMLVMPVPGDGGMEVGMSCRVCATEKCPARREGSILSPAGQTAF